MLKVFAVSLVFALTGCALTPEQQQAMRAMAAGVNSGAQAMEAQRQSLQSQSPRPMNCNTVFSGNVANTVCY